MTSSLSSLPSWQVQTSNGFMFLDVASFFLKFAVFLAHHPVQQFFLGLLLPHLHSILPSIISLWSESFVIVCPIQFRCLVLIIAGIFLLLPVLTPHLICALSNWSSSSYTPYLHFKGFQSCDVLLSHSPYFCTVQGHTSNQCFHYSFLEASSFFSILPLVILSS